MFSRSSGFKGIPWVFLCAAVPLGLNCSNKFHREENVSPAPAAPDDQEALTQKSQPLSAFFAPATVAVIGASEKPGSYGRRVLWNLISNPFGGTVFPVSQEAARVLGIEAYRSVKDIPERVDLALIVGPASGVPAIIAECAAAGVRAAIILAAGFRPESGAAQEQKILTTALSGGMRLIGPNCLGLMSPLTGLNASLAGTMARPGNVAFLSQSGALCTAVLDWSLRAMVGFSSFVSVGSMIDVSWGDLIDYFGEDPRTRSIVIYMESIGDARGFLSAAREVALAKPIIVIKAGRTEPGSKAAASHSGALTGSDEVLDAAFRRCGVLRVSSLEELFNMAEVLAKQSRPRGPRLAIVTNSGGSGVLATDALIASGGELADLSESSLAALDFLLPENWSRGNPVDLQGDATPEQFARSIEVVAADQNSDGILVILTPQAGTEPTRTAEALKPFAKLEGKPILASWMGGAEVAAGETLLNQANIPTFAFPDAAARAFYYMWRYSYNLRGIYETPAAMEGPDGTYDPGFADALIANARASGRKILSEFESKQVLSAYGIPIVETRLAITSADAVRAAQEIGYPVALKLHSETITHKSAVGGVHLDLVDASAVRNAFRAIKEAALSHAGPGHFLGVTVQRMIRQGGYEVIIGSSPDPQFGPTLLFGSGGRLAETYRDRALALPPLNSTLARRMMEQTKIFAALRGSSGGKGADISALERILVHFSDLVIEQRWIREVDINPLMVTGNRMEVADARILLYGPEVGEGEIPALAIRPYPAQYASPFTLKDGSPVQIRPIRPEDEPLMVRFHETISERSVYFRYFHPIRLTQRVAHERLARMCFIDYSREMALVVIRKSASGEKELIGVGRLIVLRGTKTAEFAIIISDQCQHLGLGRELLRRLVDIGRQEKLERIIADILPDNRDMLRVCDKIGFRRHYSIEAGIVRAEIDLAS
jgi:acetyltransferase